MSLYLFDTNVFSLYLAGHPRVVYRLLSHPGDRFGITVITVEEQLTGWYQALRRARDDARRIDVYNRMAATAREFGNWLVLPPTASALTRYTALVRMKLNVGSYDLQIAAIVLDSGATLLTRNLRDFRRVPGVVCEDWSA